MRNSKIGFGLVNELAQNASKLTPTDVLRSHERNEVLRPGYNSPTSLLELELQALKTAEKQFEVVDLPPVAAFGSSSVLSGVSQKTVLNSVRGWEVLSDPTIPLAVESTMRRDQQVQKGEAGIVRLATSARVLRMQDMSGRAGFSQHFKAVGLVSAGRDVGDRRFEIEELGVHLATQLESLASISRQRYMRNVSVYLSSTVISNAVLQTLGADPVATARSARVGGYHIFREHSVPIPSIVSDPRSISRDDAVRFGFSRGLAELLIFWEQVIEPLKQAHPSVSFFAHLDRAAGVGYYQGVCFKIRASSESEEVFPVADGGFVDWSQKMLGTRKERMLASGLGIELIHRCFSTLRTPSG